MKIGIDFDNTIACYDRAFAQVGREEGLLPVDFDGAKVAVKSWLIDRRPDGYLWEKLQGLVYGRRIDSAEIYPGLDGFIGEARRRGAELFVVSHKTLLAHHDPEMTNLRDCALRWMRTNRFFDPDGLGLSLSNVFFEPTREEKIGRIAALDLDVFVDDLPEVLEDSRMPPNCRKILFGGGDASPLIEFAATWWDIRDAIFRNS